MDITVIMPALNEEKNITSAIKNTLAAFAQFNIAGEIIVVNDGSHDQTKELINKFMLADKRINIISHDTPKGIGASFWDGVDRAQGDSVVLIPGDNENEPLEILRYLKLLKHVDLIIPFVFNKEARSSLRNLISSIYSSIINITFQVNFNYTNGTVIYRKSILKELDFRNTGFFFQTDILVRVVKKGYLFAEVPYRLGLRKEGVSKAISFSSLFKVAKGYLKLTGDFYLTKKVKEDKVFSADSCTAARRNEIGIART